MMKRALVGTFALGAVAVVACGGSVSPVDGPPEKTSLSSSSSSSGGSSGTSGVISSSSGSSGSSGSSSSGGFLREPKVHRAAPKPCTPGRFDGPSTAPDAGIDNGYIRCTSHAQCTEGKNGRCSGNGHDGWQCTYDYCDSDADCSGSGSGVCECEGGFRSDNNVCLSQGGCRTDLDCGPAGVGWCSPTLGSCGHYAKTTAYECHTAQDECVDDTDCTEGGTGPFGGSGYCAFDKTVGHWKCSTAECAG